MLCNACKLKKLLYNMHDMEYGLMHKPAALIQAHNDCLGTRQSFAHSYVSLFAVACVPYTLGLSISDNTKHISIFP